MGGNISISFLTVVTVFRFDDQNRLRNWFSTESKFLGVLYSSLVWLDTEFFMMMVPVSDLFVRLQSCCLSPEELVLSVRLMEWAKSEVSWQ